MARYKVGGDEQLFRVYGEDDVAIVSLARNVAACPEVTGLDSSTVQKYTDLPASIDENPRL
jgi:hypothetical protein